MLSKCEMKEVLEIALHDVVRQATTGTGESKKRSGDSGVILRRVEVDQRLYHMIQDLPIGPAHAPRPEEQDRQTTELVLMTIATQIGHPQGHGNERTTHIVYPRIL